MQIDTLKVNDTIVKVIEKIPNSESIEIYKEIISSQQNTYNLILGLFTALIAVFAGATYLYNRKIVKSEIKKETEEIFQREKEELIKSFQNEFKSELNFVKGESARLFAISINGNGAAHISNRYYWWVQCLKYFLQLNNGKAVSKIVNNIVANLKDAQTKKTECKEYLLANYPETEETFFNIIAKIPEELYQEKAEIIKLSEELLRQKI